MVVMTTVTTDCHSIAHTTSGLPIELQRDGGYRGVYQD